MVANGLYVGRLYGGQSSCSRPSDIDYYYQFSRTYTDIANFLLNGTPDDGLEPNDDCPNARDITPALIAGNTVKVLDEDLYRIFVPPVTRASVTLGFTHTNGDIDMEVTLLLPRPRRHRPLSLRGVRCSSRDLQLSFR